MQTKAVDAANAYASALNRTGAGGGGLETGKAGGAGSSFADLLTSALDATAEAGKTSETMVAQKLNQKSDLLDVVTAVSNAELTLDTVVAVRDKVINAYNEIMRMPI